MDDVQSRALSLTLSGQCCAQVLVSLALEDRGRDNPDFVEHVAPLCLGLQSGLTCGALSGGLMALSLLRTDGVDEQTGRAYVDWFVAEFGSSECGQLVGDDMALRAARCPGMVVDSYLHAREIAGAG